MKIKWNTFGLCFLLLGSLGLLSGCASTEKKAPKATEFQKIWKASYDIALQYPLKDLSEASGYIESDWIYATPNRRHRFFIHIMGVKEAAFRVSIQEQRRYSDDSGAWHWTSPALQHRLRLEQAINEKI